MKSKQLAPCLPGVLAAVLGLTLFSGCSTEPVQGMDFVLNTIATITIYEGGDDPDALIQEAFALCREKEALLSRTAEGSDVYRINAAGGEPVTVAAETARLLQTALDFGQLSGGKFDVTICPVSVLWDFSGEAHIPDPEALTTALAAVDQAAVTITWPEGEDADTAQVTLENPQAAIDLGGIAKGYIAGLCTDFLAENGVESAIVDLGGNIVTLGSRPDGEPFQIGVQTPFGEAGEYNAIIPAADLTVVTSGTYERCFEQDGVLYHHILDPATGYPAQTGLTAVTIVCDRTVVENADTVADGLSTVCFLLGQEEGLALVESLPGVEALFVAEDGTLTPSSGLNWSQP